MTKTFGVQEMVLLTGEELLSLDEARIVVWVQLTGGLVGRVVNPPEKNAVHARWNGWSAAPISPQSDVWKWIPTSAETKKLARDASIKYLMKHGELSKKDASLLHHAPVSHKHKILPFIKLILKDEYATMAMLNYPHDEEDFIRAWKANWHHQLPNSIYALGKREMCSLALVVKRLAPSV